MNESLWYDESVCTRATLSGASLRDVLFRDIHPPVYPLLMWGWTAVADRPEFLLRLPSLVFGLASIAVTFALARRWLGTVTAIWAAGLMAVSPAHIWYSQEAKNTMLPVLLTVTVAAMADRVWRTGTRSAWAALVALSILAFWTHVAATWFVGAAFLWLWIQELRTRNTVQLFRATAASCVVAVAFALLLVFMHAGGGIAGLPYLRRLTASEAYRLLLVYLSHGSTIRTVSVVGSPGPLAEQPWGYFLVDGFFALLLASGLWVAVSSLLNRPGMNDGSDRIDPGGAGLLAASFLVPLACTFGASLFREHVYVPRSLLSLSPFFAMLLAVGVTRFRPAKLRLPLGGILVLLSAVAVWNLHVTKADVSTVYKPNPDWRSAARYLAAERGQNGKGFPIFAPARCRPLRYYNRDTVEHSGPPPPPPDPGAMSIYYCTSMRREGWVLPEVLKEGGFSRFYVIHNHSWGWGFPEVMRAARAVPGATLTDTRGFDHLTIYRFDVGAVADGG